MPIGDPDLDMASRTQVTENIAKTHNALMPRLVSGVQMNPAPDGELGNSETSSLADFPVELAHLISRSLASDPAGEKASMIGNQCCDRSILLTTACPRQ
jgi:hypothetical protein